MRIFGIAIVIWLACQLPAQAETIELVTSDPNHPGWVDLRNYKKSEARDYLKRAKKSATAKSLAGELKFSPIHPVKWQPIKTDCVPCQSLVAQYNGAMQGLMNARYRGRYLVFRFSGNPHPSDVAAPFFMEGAYVDLAQERVWLQHYDKLAKKFAQLAQTLRQQIAKCEQQCKGPKAKKTGIKLGGLPPIKGSDPKVTVKVPVFEPRIHWKGPYPAKCFRCAKLAARLNEIPQMILERQMKLWVDAQDQPPPSVFRPPKLEVEPKASVQIKRLVENFEATLKLYNKCVKECPKKVSYCPDPAANEAVAIGANADVGSGAKLEQRLTDAFGMGGSPFGGAIGGGFGGGPPAGTGGSSGPEVHDDKVPDAVKQQFVHAATGLALSVGGVFDPSGLMTSISIENAPADGTFQSIFIEDAQGRRGKPIGYWIISIYSDWSITVSWSYTRWVDGEVVEHREGGWSDEGSELISRYSIPVFGEGLWKEFGFSNAVKGLKGLNALFPVSAERLAYEPMYLVVHVTQPDKDPVTTIPMIIKLGADAQGKLTMQQVAATQADQDCVGKPRQKSQGDEQIDGGKVKPQPKPKPRSKLDQQADDILDAF